MSIKIIYITTCSILFTMISHAQPANLDGAWKGMLQVMGQELPIVFHFEKQASGVYTATFDSPKQNAFGLGCGSITGSADSIAISIPSINGGYYGHLVNDSIVGNWRQGAMGLPLNLKRTADKKDAFDRPQTPKPPYPYGSEDVRYKSEDGKISYGATITFPQDGKRHPAIVLISGSGQQDRNCTLMGHQWFLVLAHHLTQKGFVVLRVDDRGVGQTTGEVMDATSADFATDVEQGIRFLKSRKETDIKKIGLIGHSEGAIIAPMVAARNKDVSFVVMLAGSAVGGAIINEEQNVAGLRKGNASASDIDSFRVVHKLLQQAAMTATTDPEFETMVRKVMKEHKSVLGSDEGAIKETIKNYNDLRIPWFKFFMAYDPMIDIQKLSVPVLALNGSKDTQVDAKTNLPLIAKALAKKNPLDQTKELSGLNHLFQTCVTGELDEYAKIEETISPKVLQTISDWLLIATR